MANKVQVITDDDAEFVCAECAGELEPVVEKAGNDDDEAKRKRQKRFISIAGIAAAVVVLAGAGFGISKLFGGGQEIDKIKLDPKSITLDVGQKDVIKATVVDKDGKEITDAKVVYKWTVKNEKVASVTQGGEVAALKKGKTSITVKIEGDDTHRATCQVEVKGGGTLPPPPPPGGTLIETISITDGTSVSLKKGDTKQLQYQATPESNSETPAWVSSDQSVATVDATGLVTAVKKGTAQISVKAKKVASAPVTVTVTEEPTEEPPLNPSWGRYEGKRVGGKPHGNGVLYITRQHTINGETAHPGERIEGVFRNGYVNMGTWFKNDGNAVVVKDVKVL